MTPHLTSPFLLRNYERVNGSWPVMAILWWFDQAEFDKIEAKYGSP